MAVFKIVLIKPSHYDADGYVIQWWRSTIPSNSLASVYGLLTECADAQVLGPDVEIDIDAYDECNTIIDIKGTIARKSARRAPASSAWSACSRTSIRARSISRAQFRAAGRPGGDRRVPCLRLHLDAAQAAPRPAGGARPRRDAVRRRRRRPHGGRSCATSRPEPRSRSTTISPTCPDMAAATLPDPAAQHRDARRRQLYELRCRARLSVPVLVLHHHQRAGPQVALSHAGRRRGDRPRQRQAGHHQLLRHRRQLRPQQELGADPRPADRAAREGRLQDPPAAAGRHAVPPHSGLHREGGARGLQRGVHRAREHQSGVARRHQEAAEQDLGISRDAPGLAQAEGR